MSDISLRQLMLPTHKPVVRVKMGRQRLNGDGLRMHDPVRTTLPWLYEEPKIIELRIKK